MVNWDRWTPSVKVFLGGFRAGLVSNRINIQASELRLSEMIREVITGKIASYNHATLRLNQSSDGERWNVYYCEAIGRGLFNQIEDIYESQSWIVFN